MCNNKTANNSDFYRVDVTRNHSLRGSEAFSKKRLNCDRKKANHETIWHASNLHEKMPVFDKW